MERADVLIIGAGPAGIFTALTLLERGYRGRIVLVEQGNPIEKRHCPKDRTKECAHCKPFCNVTSGFSGAGAFSDGKLSLSPDVGGDFPELVGRERAEELIRKADELYLSYGADPHVAGRGGEDRVKEVRLAAIRAGLKLVDCPIRHLGTERAQELFLKLEKHLAEEGVTFLFGYSADDLIVERGCAVGARLIDAKSGQALEIASERVVVATGRKGADWFEGICRKYGVERTAGVVDVGVRLEVRTEVMEEVNNLLYESKLIGYPPPFRDKVRTFCQNPGGFVAQENYDELAVVNGHSFKTKKSENTNLAVLVSHHFRTPFDRPIDYARKVGELVNMLGDGHILVQRFGDILAGKRTWERELARSNVKPTLKDAVAGDITAALPFRTMSDIIAFIKAADTVVPGLAGEETLLYAPEIKFYSNRVTLSPSLQTSLPGLFALGDSSGWSRGLMMASAMGIALGESIPLL